MTPEASHIQVRNVYNHSYVKNMVNNVLIYLDFGIYTLQLVASICISAALYSKASN